MITPGFAYNIARYFPSGTDYDKQMCIELMDKIGASTNPSTWNSPGAVFLLLIPKVKKKCINFFVVIHSCSVSNANTTEKRSPFKKPSAKECHAIAHQRYRAFLHDYKPKRIQGCLWLSSRKCKVKIIYGLVASPSLATEVKNLRVAWIFLFTFVSFKKQTENVRNLSSKKQQ